jgi:ATP-dependent exoDNAse (exonuclease V) alpha subunit
VLVTRNDYGLGLMNGDIGIALRLPDDQGQARCAWPSRVTTAVAGCVSSCPAA